MHREVFAAFDRLCREHGAGGVVLEIGATGSDDALLCLPALAGSVRRFGINLAPQTATHGFEIIVGNANEMATVPDASIDTVLCNSVLEHDARFWLTLTEVRRVLKPGGLFLVGVPGYSERHRAGWLIRLLSRLLPASLPLGRGLQAKAASTPTLVVHHYPRDYYRFGRDAIGDVFLAEMDIVTIEEILNPPRFIAVARQR